MNKGWSPVTGNVQAVVGLDNFIPYCNNCCSFYSHFKILKVPKHYVTLGQIHIHNIDGKIIDKDTVVRFDASSAEEGRERAVRLFGTRFSTDYHDKDWKESKMKFFPKGYVDID